MRRLIRPQWNRDPEAGSVLVFWGVAIVVLLGMVALSFDVGRISATQSELQSYADNLATAAAAELDGEDDSIDRAIAAVATLITDTQTFGEGGRQLTAADYDLVFFRRGSGGPGTVISANPATLVYTAADQSAARYVRAVVGPRNVGTPFAAVLSLITGDALVSTDVGAQATAGLDEFACDITPLMFCIPQTDPPWTADGNIGQMIRLRTGGQGAPWGPGNFGFLDPSSGTVTAGNACAGLNGAQLDVCLIAAERGAASCFNQEGVDTEPGQKSGRNASAFNVFFDIFDSTANNLDKNANYPAAPNVIKGIKPKGGGKCIQGNYEMSGALPLPRDDCFYGSTCDEGNRIGDGVWSTRRADYITANHDGDDPTEDFALPGDYAGTRFEMYRAEVKAAAGGKLTTVGNEDGLPSCTKNVSDINRRVLVAAGIDCTRNPVSGRAEDVPVYEFVRIFLTEPVGYPPTKTKKTVKNNQGEDVVVEDYFFDDSEAFDIHVEVLGTAEEETAIGPALIRKVVRLVE